MEERCGEEHNDKAEMTKYNSSISSLGYQGYDLTPGQLLEYSVIPPHYLHLVNVSQFTYMEHKMDTTSCRSI